MLRENIVKTFFDANLLDSNECHLHYYDFRHSLNFEYINFYKKNLGPQRN
jgi:hypothetical protein